MASFHHLPLILALAMVATRSRCSASTYYIAAGGNDTNSGLSASAPLQSLAKIGSLNLLPGDQVLFNRGDTFRGPLSLSRSGTPNNPIVIDAYGTGNLPALSGAVPVTNWSNISGNLWQASFPGAGSLVTGLYSNGVSLQLGRWPRLTAPNGGYLTADSATGQVQLTSAALGSAPTNDWTGAEVVCRTMQWVLDRATITSQTGSTLNFTYLYPSAYNVQPGWGFFIQNHIATLAQPGEWCFNNGTKLLTLYSTSDPNNWALEATLANAVINLQGPVSISNVTVQNLEVTGGLHQNIYVHNATNLAFNGVQVVNGGEDGLVIDGSGGGITITNCVFNHINNTAIKLTGYYPGYVIRGCTFTDIATTAGRGLGGDNQMGALFQWSGNATPGTASIIADNLVDGVGYLGFFFNQSDITLQHNIVRNYDLVKDDGGGIYTWNDQNPQPFTNQFILNNVVYNAVGATNGVVNYYPGAVGIYLDGHSENIVVASNTVFHCAGHGLLLNNDVSNATLTANTVFDNGNQLSVNQRNMGDAITSNIFFCKYPWQTAAKILNDTTNLSVYGLFDRNYYCRPFDDVLTLNFNQNWQNSMDLSLSGWQALFGKDLHSQTSPINYTSYLSSSTGTNQIGNGTFDSNISGWAAYGGSSNNVTAVWDNSGKLSGGCLKLSFTSPSGNMFNTLNGFDYQDIFPVTNGSVYLLSFDAAGASQSGVLRTYLFQNNAPWHTVTTPVRGLALGTNMSHFDVFLTVTESIPTARLQWQLTEGSDQQTVWLDNIRLRPATVAAVDPDTCIRFEYNPTSLPQVVALASTCVDVTGSRYSGSVTVPPFGSVVLLKSDPPSAVSISPPTTGTVATLWSGIPGGLYQVQTSTNLIDWGVLGWFPAAADGAFSVLDTNASAPVRFYRAWR